MSKLDEMSAEGARILTICNACRYCEGYCAVFPAMERRLDFASGDMSYLANLCHSCGECHYACQFSPPHEFNLNVPVTMSKIRTESYREYAWPGFLAAAFNRNGIGTAVVLVALITIAMFIGVRALGSDFTKAVPSGDFYAAIPHAVMAGTFGWVGLFVLIAMLIGLARFWRHAGEPIANAGNPAALGQALRDVFTLKYLHRAGAGCAVSDTKRSVARRHAHHLTFYGFLLCFAATVLGTIYHYAFGWKAPYGYFSLPVILGTLGGIGLLIGPPALYMIRKNADPDTVDREQEGIADALIALLVLTSASGLALLAWRATAAMPTLLIVHLAIVMTLFITLPYGKFMHGLYRFAALIKYALESKRPFVQVGGE